MNKVIRMVAYILQFVKNCKIHKVKRSRNVQIPVIDVEEREIAFLKIVQIIQFEEISDELATLQILFIYLFICVA